MSDNTESLEGIQPVVDSTGKPPLMGGSLALAKNTVSSKPKIFAWSLWDWGTQPFYTVITTFVFSVYITKPDFFAWNSNANGPSLAYSVSVTICGVFIALVAPVLGQSADRSGHLVRNMRILTWGLGLVSAALWFVEPRPGFLVLGLVLLAVGTVIGEISGSFYNATIDQVATEKNVGKVSGFGWGMGYIGGILVLLLILFLVGVDSADQIRLGMVVCGVWILVFTVPAFLVLHDRPAVKERASKLGVIGSYKALFRSIREIWHTDRQVAYFLLASAVFRDGLAAVFSFGATIASLSFGFEFSEVVMFGAAANLIAGLITMLFGLLDDKLGSKKIILICLGILIAGCVLTFFLHRPEYGLHVGDVGYDAALSHQGKVIFWVLGLSLSSFCGPAQAAARSFLARIIPEGHSGEIFGLYTTTGRVISFLSPALFGVMVWVGSKVSGVSSDVSAQHWGLWAIAIVLAAGFLVLLPVKAKPREKV
ncbi:MAG: MFS transporter [Propionibacteriaceae bacterium]|jgi:UMF1 family MFS transporter|nr:MFS transporter [Propionibacteriaceae bacterium]